MKRITIILIALLALPAAAVDLDFGIGQTKFQRTEDSVYWQQGSEGYFAHTLNLKTTSYELSASGYVTDNMRLRVGYKHFGSPTTQAQAATDETYVIGGGCVPTGCEPAAGLSTFKTQGRLQGIPVTLEPEMRLGSFKLIGIAGFMLYKADIKVQATRCLTCPQTTGIYNASKVDVSPVLGFGVERSNVQFRLTMVQAGIGGGHFTGLTENWDSNKIVNVAMTTRF